MKTKILSPGTGKPVNLNQYLAEFIIERQARSKGIRLPKQYWVDKTNYLFWATELGKQARGAASLLKLYEFESIVETLKENEWIVSFYVKKLDAMVREKERQRKLVQSVAQPVTEIVVPEGKPLKLGKSSHRAKLK